MKLKCEYPFEGGCKEEATRVLFQPDWSDPRTEIRQEPDTAGQPFCGDHLPEMVHEARMAGELDIYVADITNVEQVKP